MRNFNKKILNIYIPLIVLLLIGKFYLEPNYNKFYINWFLPIFLIVIALGCFFLNKYRNIRKNKQKDISENIIIVMLIYLIIYFTSGLIFTYAKSPYNHSILGILKNCWNYVLIIFLIEYTRDTLFQYSGIKKRYIILITSIFILLELDFIQLFLNLNDFEIAFKYISVIIIPVIVQNILSSYLVYYSGFRAGLVYRLPLILISILLPIYPNLNWFMISFYQLVLAMVIYISVNNYLTKFVLKIRKNRIVRFNFITNLPLLILLTITFLFMIGVFKYKPIAVISDSMKTAFSRGDVVVSQKISSAEQIRLYDIIEYTMDNTTVIHRVNAIDINHDGKLIFITKGDNNEKIDNYVVNEEQIIGIVKFKIPIIGFPTVWINEIVKNIR